MKNIVEQLRGLLQSFETPDDKFISKEIYA